MEHVIRITHKCHNFFSRKFVTLVGLKVPSGTPLHPKSSRSSLKKNAFSFSTKQDGPCPAGHQEEQEGRGALPQRVPAPVDGQEVQAEVGLTEAVGGRGETALPYCRMCRYRIIPQPNIYAFREKYRLCFGTAKAHQPWRSRLET